MRFTKQLFKDYVEKRNDVKIKNENAYEDKVYDFLDDMNCRGDFNIPRKYCKDYYNVQDDEAVRYFEYLVEKYDLVNYLKELK